jgi:hypothetical protein
LIISCDVWTISKSIEKSNTDRVNLRCVKLLFQKNTKSKLCLKEMFHIMLYWKRILRSYTTDEKRNEHIMKFAFEGWWISDLSSLMGAFHLYKLKIWTVVVNYAAREELMNALPVLNATKGFGKRPIIFAEKSQPA